MQTTAFHQDVYGVCFDCKQNEMIITDVFYVALTKRKIANQQATFLPQISGSKTLLLYFLLS